MQAKYKLLTNHSPLLENDDSSKPVPGYDPGHTLGPGGQEPHTVVFPNFNARTAETLTTLEESVCQLWAREPPSESKAGFSPCINVLDSNNGDPTPEAHFKPNFKQFFDHKTLTIPAFLTIYKTAMRRASYKINKKHILTCLHPTCQEVVVPELHTFETWEDMKQLLIDKFGGDLSLEVKKDALIHIAFKPKETLAEVADRFYMEGQQLITSRQLTAHEAYMA
ncbi:hypothetical protein DSO57_1002382 [Entomophthora muscae]|uniref:Uncharacterized protein n=1 Tax=Entomophthora muscae TaxID=34485 RepID=A0ACC2RNR7_9FUNG|nr:hypothetical protein DSO57_1002382 [Entomophthora muscae]